MNTRFSSFFILIGFVLHWPLYGQFCNVQSIDGQLSDPRDLLNGITSTINISIPVSFHVLYKTDGTGNIPDSDLQVQIDVLNSGFNTDDVNFKVSFYLASISRTQNDSWFQLPAIGPVSSMIQNALTLDPAHVLNVYIGDVAAPNYGWSTFPWEYSESSKNHGIMLDYMVLPNGLFTEFNLGEALVHEVGHYFGLKHTFQDGCVSSGTGGDNVADTPAHIVPTLGVCPAFGTDTCPLVSGFDPNDNQMNYTSDLCRVGFTQGQIDRMTTFIISNKQSLNGSTIDFTNNLTVSSNQTWNFYDSTLKFVSSKKLYIYGVLYAERVHFTGNPTWNGLYFGSGSTGTITGTSTSKSRIDKVTGGAGGAAVQVYNSSPLLQHTIIETEPGSYVYGVYASGSSGYSMSPTILYSLLRSRSAPALYKSSGTYTYAVGFRMLVALLDEAVLPQADSALLELGRHIAVLADAVQPAGTHTVTVDGARWPNGMYLYRLAAGEHLQTGHLVLAR
jgi:hypothetical protein